MATPADACTQSIYIQWCQEQTGQTPSIGKVERLKKKSVLVLKWTFKGMALLLLLAMPFRKKPFYTYKWDLSGLFLAPLYLIIPKSIIGDWPKGASDPEGECPGGREVQRGERPRGREAQGGEWP